METKRLRIECSGTEETIDLDNLEPFQGDLKRRTPEDIARVIKSIEEYGFSFPFFVWKNRKHNWCLDGHGRILALAEMRAQGWTIPPLPVVCIKARGVDEAKQKLLRMNSQYGEITVDGLLAFTEGLEIEWSDLSLPAGQLAMGGAEEEAVSEYTRLINTPLYKPTGEKPTVAQLTDMSTTNALLERIRKAKISDEEKAFLTLAAMRHVVFSYSKIAEFYAHAPARLQRLMEDSALVIIDFNKAIELGFVKLSDRIRELYLEDTSNE